MDNATVASMQGTVGRTDAGSAPGIACQQMPLSFLKGGETGTIAKVRGRGDLHHHLENLGFVEGAGDGGVEAAGDLIVGQGHQVALNARSRRISSRTPPRSTSASHARARTVFHEASAVPFGVRASSWPPQRNLRETGHMAKFKIERCARAIATLPPSVA
ncbi:MAG: FeoA domain-containing protein [Eggerthellaceae bacterium]